MSSGERTMPVWHERHLRAATDAAGVALWSWNVDTDAITMDERAYDLWEVSKTEENVTFEILSKNIHPADLERVRSAFAATRAIVGSYEIDFRVLSGVDIRWISARGKGDDADISGRLMFGIFLDVTQRKQAEEASALLAGEMSHRVKNLLQIATALTQITSRSTTTKEEMASDLTRRLMALWRAQELVRPVPVRRQLKRRYVLAFFQKLPPCLVGIEACASAHHWSRELQALGHTVRLMPPAYVKPYVKRQKNDATDAEAICEAVTRANMRFVPTKTPEQQSGLMLHRTRHLFIRQQT